VTRKRRIGLALILLASGISSLWGSLLGHNSPNSGGDFKGVYYDARCLLQHRDLYKEGEPLRVYKEENGELPESSHGLRQVLTLNVYLPTTFIFIAPFAMLPWGPAHLLWLLVTAVSFTLAAFLIWDIGAKYAPVIACGLICFLLANSELLYGTGNAAGMAVSLCVVAVWCFLKERFVLAGVLCLAVSLAIKPHDAGLVWLYFLLAGGVFRKRALQSLALTAVLGLAAILWVTQVAPNWMQELHADLQGASAPGGLSNPAIDSVTGRSPAMVIDLQSALSVFRDDPRIYNPVSYLVCGALLLVWLVPSFRLRFSQRRAWFALAAVVPLTMLVTYHRPYDAKLLLLTVPACAMLWAEGGRSRWVALLVNGLGIVLAGDIPLVIFVNLYQSLHLSTVELSGKIMTVLLMRPVPLILLAMAIFYLWVYVRRGGQDAGNGLDGKAA